MGAALLFVAQLTIAISAPDTIPLGRTGAVTVRMAAEGRLVPRLTPPHFGELSVVRSSYSSRTVRRPSGRRVMEAEYRYLVSAPAAGTYTLPPFVAHSGSRRAVSRPVRIVVRAAGPASSGTPAVVMRAPVDPAEPVNFRVLVAPDTVYVGEQVSYQVALFVDDDLRSRLRRNPEFFAPDTRSVMTYDLLPAAGAPFRRTAAGRHYEAHVYERAMFPLVPGSVVLPPARLLYSVPLSSSFFSREEVRELRSDSAVVLVRELPEEGRPAAFSGVVGDVTITSSVDTIAGRAGEPLLLTARVTGRGNVKLFPRPVIDIPWAMVVAAAERVEVDSATPVIRGSKEFEWLVTPREHGVLELPAIAYPYFSASTHTYETALTRPETLHISAAALVAADSGAPPAAPRLPLRTELRGALPPPIYEHPVFWLVLLTAPLPAAGAALLVRRPRRAPVEQRAALALRALGRGREVMDARLLRRTFVRALRERLYLNPARLMRRGSVLRGLRRAGVPAGIAADVEELLLELDAAAYDRQRVLAPDAAARAYSLYRQVDATARTRRALAAVPARVLILLVLSASALAAAAEQAVPAQQFSRGVSEYDAGRFDAARDAFAAVAAEIPRAPDAWANLGTTSWAAGDTAGAVMGWQRALRLEPLALDVRRRLALVDVARVGEYYWVPPVPPQILAATAALLWVLAWALALLAAVRVSPARARARRYALNAGALSILLALGAGWVDERLAARELVVISTRSAVRGLPVLAGEPAAVARAGDVARRLEERGPWARVELSGGGDGWVESERLLPLARR